MIQQSILPAEHLRKYIREYVLVHLEIDQHISVPVKPYPANPEQGITFYAKGFVTAYDIETGTAMRRPQTVIFGQPLSMQHLQPTHEYLMFDIRFQPGALYQFLKIPLTEFVHKNIDAELILGKEIHTVHEQLANEHDYANMITIVENYLWNKIKNIKEDNHPFEKIGKIIQDGHQPFYLDKLARETCMSVSQFERKFQQRTGVTPKYFSRICRFHRAFSMKENQPALDWRSIAWETGYSDYQHLVKDFKEFSGSTPKGLIEAYHKNVDDWLYTGLIPNFV